MKVGVVCQNCDRIARESFQIGDFTINGYNGECNDFRCDYSLEYICEKFSP